MAEPARAIALPASESLGGSSLFAGLIGTRTDLLKSLRSWGGYLGSRLGPPVVTTALLLLVWQLAAGHAGSPLPSPLKVVEESRDIIMDPFRVGRGIDQGLFWHVLASLTRVAYGFALAAVVGIALGVLLGQSTLAMRGLDPVFQVLRTVPPLAWLPLSLAAFRDGQPSAIFVIFITSVWPILINTSVGIRNIPQDYRNVAKVLRLSPLEFFTRIMVPSTVPYMFTGLRIASASDSPARDRRGGNADRRRGHRILHLGRLELLAHLRHHRRPRLCGSGRLHPRPAHRVDRNSDDPRHGVRRPA